MAIPPLPTTPDGIAAYIKQEREKVIGVLVVKGRRLGKVPDPNDEPVKSLLPRLNALLDRLEFEITMTGNLKRETKIDAGLELIFMPAKEIIFSDEHMERARRLHEQWEDLVPAAPPVRPPPSASHGDNDEDHAPKRRKMSSNEVMSGDSSIKPPPPTHPIWGINGIMHGLALKVGAKNRKSTVLNPSYREQQIDCKAFGHNNNKVGSWYPNRLSALFHGAHGHSQAGIHGSAEKGAYSIVVSGGEYHLLDEDRGDRLFYSGSGSHENRNPNEPAPATEGTKALDKSLETGRPVRVLRTNEGHSRWRPIEGIRYDGLYRVVHKRYPMNAKRGMYEQFELERLDEDEEQCSLDACRRRPTGREMGDLIRSKDGYESRR